MSGVGGRGAEGELVEDEDELDVSDPESEFESESESAVDVALARSPPPRRLVLFAEAAPAPVRAPPAPHTGRTILGGATFCSTTTPPLPTSAPPRVPRVAPSAPRGEAGENHHCMNLSARRESGRA